MSYFRLEHWANLLPKKIAIQETERNITFGELHQKAKRLTRYLYQCGLHAQDTILIFLSNCIEFSVIFHAAADLGLRIVLANPLFKVVELTQLFQETQPKIVFIDSLDNLKLVKSLEPDILIIDVNTDIFQWHTRCDADDVDTPLRETCPQCAEVVVCTSGSTGRLKFVIRTLENQQIPAQEILNHLHADERDIFLICLPMSQQYGLIAMLMACMAGGTIVLMKSFKAEKALQVIEKFRVTVQFGVPTMYGLEIDAYMELEKKPDISSLRTGMISGSASPIHYFQWFEEKAACVLLNSYGTTEIAAVTMTNCSDQPYVRYNTCGQAFQGVELKIVDDAGNDLPCGIEGEILCKSPYAMKGYLGKEKLTQNAFSEDGWFLTGDIGLLDENGRLSIIGRKKDMIIRGGYNIYPAEVEKVLLSHSGIIEACVLGVPDRTMGERIYAFIRLKCGVHETAESLRDSLRQCIAKYKIPDYFFFLNEVPKLQNGKSDYNALAAMLRIE